MSRPVVPARPARSVLAVLCALVLTASLAACTGSSTSNTYRFTSATKTGALMPVGQRKAAPDFTGSLLAGGHTSLKANAGKVTVVNFWASWCGPCKVETPQFALLSKQVQKQGVAFLGIDTKDDKANAQTFVQQNGVGYPIVYDQQGRTAITLGNIPANLPFTVLVDRKGRVAAVYFGGLTVADLRPPIQRLVAEG